MKVSYIIVLTLLLFSACNHTSHTGQVAASTQDTLLVHREYYRYGETIPFMDEYGRVIQSSQGDTSKLQYCKDSMVTFHHTSQSYIRSQKEICYPHLSIFENTQLIPEKRKNTQQGWIETQLISSKNLGNFPVHRIEVDFLQTMNGQPKRTIHSNEYWNDKLGLILKIDQNQMINRKRIIQLKSAILPNGDSIQFENILPQLYADSLDWLVEE